MDFSRSNDLITEIAVGVVNDPRIASRDWASLSVVAILQPGASQMSVATYDANGVAEPATPRDFDMIDRFEDLREAMREGEKPAWTSCLLTIVRETGEFKMAYEYDDPLRWKTTPDNLATMPAALRPL